MRDYREQWRDTHGTWAGTKLRHWWIWVRTGKIDRKRRNNKNVKFLLSIDTLVSPIDGRDVKFPDCNSIVEFIKNNKYIGH